MTRHTPSYSLPAPEATDPVVTSDDIWQLALTVAQQLGIEANVLTDLANKKLPMMGNLAGDISDAGIQALAPGMYGVPSPRPGMPEERQGALLVLGWGSGRAHIFVTGTLEGTYGPEIWVRTSGGSGAFGSEGFRRVFPIEKKTRIGAVTLNHPRGMDSETGRNRQYRWPFKIPVPGILRRAGFGNFDYNSNTVGVGQLDFRNGGVGEHQMNPDGSMTGLFPAGSTVHRVASQQMTPVDGSPFYGDDVNIELEPHKEYLLSYAFGATEDQTVIRQLGRCFSNTQLGSWNATGIVTSTPQTFGCLNVWLEIETDAGVEWWTYYGDSQPAGLSTENPAYDGWARKHAYLNGAMSTVIAQPGGSLVDYQDPNTPKLHQFAHLTTPDRLYVGGLGSNDVSNGASTATLAVRLEAMVANVRAATGCNSVYYTTTLPRTADGPTNGTRLEYNDLMMSVPHHGIAAFDHFAAVVDPLTGLMAEKWRGPGNDVHMTSAGNALVASATGGIAQEIPRPYTITETAGRVVKVWDYLNNREQVVHSDTGLRKLTPNALFTDAGQEVTVSRENSIVSVTGWRLAAPTAPAGDVVVVNLPPGFRPHNLSRLADTTFRGRPLAVAANGDLTITDPSGAVDHFNITFRTPDAWPASLPGTAVGIIPYQ